jgi:hypothetical protein
MVALISRADWGARASRKVASTSWRNRTAFMVHHSGGPATQTPRQIQDWCMDGRKFADVDYNFLIDQQGRIYVGRGWTIIGAHCVGWNTKAIGVCVIGNNQLSAAAKAALRELYAEAVRKAGKSLAPMVHSDGDKTACPGAKLRQWVKEGGLAPRNLSLKSPMMRGADVAAIQRIVGADDDGIFGPDTDRKVRAWQSDHGLKSDGIVGPKTRAAMGI